MREIVLDTETTGLDPLRGDRLVEIGCIEIYNRMPTGQTFHRYINPQRDMPAEAFAVHGLSSEFLADKPLVDEVVEESLEFIGDEPLEKCAESPAEHPSGTQKQPFQLFYIIPHLPADNPPPIPRDRLVDTLLL